MKANEQRNQIRKQDVSLKPTDIRSRNFLLQYMEAMKEFGEIIPWLEPLKSITYSTNSTYFRDRFLEHLGCEEENIVPYQLTFGWTYCF